MPPQKNSGNKGAKRETGASMKNRRFVQNFLDDLRVDGSVTDVHIGRVLRKMGDGRMEVFYVDTSKKTEQGNVAQAKIPGKFSGRGKHSVWIDVGTFVAIASNGLGGGVEFEIAAVFTPDQMREISKEFDMDPRVLALDITDSSQLTKRTAKNTEVAGYEFDIHEEVDVENI